MADSSPSVHHSPPLLHAQGTEVRCMPRAVTLEVRSELTSYQCHTLMKRKSELHDFVCTQKIAFKSILNGKDLKKKKKSLVLWLSLVF